MKIKNNINLLISIDSKNMKFSSTNYQLLIQSGYCSLFCKTIYHGKPALEGFEFKNQCFSKGIWKDKKLVEGEKFFTNGIAEKGYFANNRLYYGERNSNNIIETGFFQKENLLKDLHIFLMVVNLRDLIILFLIKELVNFGD